MTKRNRPIINAKKEEDNINQQENLIAQLQKEKKQEKPKKTKAKKLRFTMDLPISLHKEISNRIEESGQTMKGYFVSLAKKDLRKNKDE